MKTGFVAGAGNIGGGKSSVKKAPTSKYRGDVQGVSPANQEINGASDAIVNHWKRKNAGRESREPALAYGDHR